MKKFLTSRKFLFAVATGVLVVLNDVLDLQLDHTTITTVAGVAVSYILGQAHVDAKAANGGGISA